MDLNKPVAQMRLAREMARPSQLHWWQLHTAAEWQYQRAVYWEQFPSGTVVVYE